jgi:hypothetical protein
MISEKLLNKQKAIKVSNLIPNEFCQFFTHVLLRQSDEQIKGDEQIPNAKAILSHHLIFDTLLEHLWPLMEEIVGEELLPTYSYARLYSNGDILEKHTDRPACEVSVTIQLGRSHEYSWPICMGNQKFELNVGDGVIYSGCDVPHWRNICNGPDGYYSGQVFLHYVRKNGSFIENAGDAIIRRSPTFIKNRI